MTTKDYIDKYEDLSNRGYGFNSHFHIETFVGRLKLETRNEVILFDPKSVVEAKKLALVKEVKPNDQS